MKSLNANFTQVPNMLLAMICRLRCSGLQKDILLCIVRFTFGYHRPDTPLSLSFIAKYTIHTKPRISEGLSELVGKKVVLVSKNYNKNQPRRLMINPKYDEWEFVKGKQFESRKQIGSAIDNDLSSDVGNQQINKNKEKKGWGELRLLPGINKTFNEKVVQDYKKSEKYLKAKEEYEQSLKKELEIISK